MKFINILTALWAEPWLILPAAHKQICDIVSAHFNGTAHSETGISTLFPEQEEEESISEVRGNIGVIRIAGALGKHVGGIAKSSGVTDIDDIEEALDDLLSNKDVTGILLDINSPGGSVTGIPELAEKIAAATIQKPVVAYTDSCIASAAYWLASGADAIYASKSAQVGSIGVYQAWLDTSRQDEMAGIRTELIKRGKFKAIGMRGTTLSDEAREMLQKNVDEVYGWFTEHVRAYREDIPAEAMEGQMFYGEEAVRNDLVDAVGTINDAANELANMASA